MVTEGQSVLYGGRMATVVQVHPDGRVSITIKESTFTTTITTYPGLDLCWDATREQAKGRREVLQRALHGTLKGE